MALCWPKSDTRALLDSDIQHTHPSSRIVIMQILFSDVLLVVIAIIAPPVSAVRDLVDGPAGSREKQLQDLMPPLRFQQAMMTGCSGQLCLSILLTLLGCEFPF